MLIDICASPPGSQGPSASHGLTILCRPRLKGVTLERRDYKELRDLD